jgi:hypothetical protein
MALTKRQIEALKSVSVDVNHIVADENGFRGLNEEIAETYNQNEAAKLAMSDPTLKNVAVAVPKVEPVTVASKPVPRQIKTNPRPVKTNTVSEVSMQLPNLDDELDAALAQARKTVAATPAPAPAPEPVAEEVSFKSQVEELLARIPGAPSMAQIEAFKKSSGGVYATAFSEKDIFLYTFLKRSQWNKIREIIDTKVETIQGTDPQRELKEKVVKACVLWPDIRKDEFVYSAPAGLVDTLFELIMLHSYFLSTQQAMQLTVSL